MTYDLSLIGPTLKALRLARELKQSDVARALGRSEPNVSRLESPGANPQASSLFAYLEAIGSDLMELHQRLASQQDPINVALDQQVAEGRKRIETEPAYRRLAEDLLKRFGGEELPPGMRVFAELIDARFRELESRLPPRGEEGSSNGTDGGLVES